VFINRQIIQGDNIFIPHPTEAYKRDTYEIMGGQVNILHYSDGTVLVQIIQAGKQPAIWVNRNIEYDPTTNTARIIPGSP